MVIKNRWRQVLSAKGITQADLAGKFGIPRPTFSLVVQGTAMLPLDDLEKVCRCLDIEPKNVYSPDVLLAVYGMEKRDEEEENERVISIKLRGKYADAFLKLKKESCIGTNAGVVQKVLQLTYPNDFEEV